MVVCPAGRPTNSTTPHTSLLKALMGHPSYSRHPGRPWAFLEGMVSLSFWQAEGPPLLFLFVLGRGAPQVPGSDPCLRMVLPLAHGRSHAFLVCVDSGICPIDQRIYSAGGCHYDCVGIGHSLFPGSTSQCPAPVSGQLPKTACGLPWPLGGPNQVSLSSHETGIDLLIS